MKNPMKMTKLQRQNSLNMYGITIGNGGQPWLGGSSTNTMSKIHQKGINAKVNFGSTNTDSKLHTRTNLRVTNMTGFPESGDALVNENDNMCWEQTRNNLESTNTTNSHTHIKMLDGINIDSVVGVPHGVALNHHNQNSKSTISADINSGDNSIPSLQGVKVPDENLTPQQRQHREEQLAKLKKMNQFLFPENGNDFRSDANNTMQGSNPLGKISGDGISNNLSGIMLNIPTSGTSTIGPQTNTNLNPSGMRNMTNNIMNQNKTENIGASIGDESAIATDMMNAHEISSIQCNNTKAALTINNQSNLPCGSSLSLNSMTAGNISNNIVPCVGSTSNSGGHTGNVNLMPNSPEVLGFNQNCVGNDSSLTSAPNKAIATGLHGQEGMSSQMDWSKLQNQFFDERMKNSKITADINCIPHTLCRSNSTGVGNLRANLTPVPVSSTGQSSQAQGVRSNQGPPPPYHPTQRCASVPIATQSPNPTSPNNPTSNLSLPSPRTTGTLGIPANSPNMDSHVATTMSTTTSASSLATSSSMNSAMVHTKSNYQTQEISSPTNNANNNNNTTNTNRSRNNVTQFNSNPSTPISHMSPKDMEPFNTNTTGNDLKNARPSPQRSRTPLMSTSNNNMTEQAGVESRFSNCSPGLNFNPHIQNNSAGVNAYKSALPIERQNATPNQGQFCRRSDNVPLNPNSNRSSHNKMNLSFDPISSLAQMSQQLTSCVPMNAGVGNIGDLNMSSNVNIDGMISSIDGNMELCNPGSVGNMSVPQQMNSGGSFNSNNCHINAMLNPMGQRLLNPKMCGGFSTNNGGMREGPGNFHGMMPGHPRMMGRMPFGNFNVSPNIQVKASTPNTIQYMPVRPQNNTNNMRMPPSLEFLQRYANPQMSNASNILDNSHMTQNSTGITSEQNKISNNANNNIQGGHPGMNFFQNCNQMGVVNSIGMEQEELSGSMLAEINISNPMIRNMRPMRQHSLGNPIIQGTRMQVPGMTQYSGTSTDNLECNDPNTIFGTGNNSTVASQMFAASNQQKQIKGISGLCQNMNPVNVNSNNMQVQNSALVQNEAPAMQTAINASPTIQGGNTNANIIQSTLGLGSNGPQPSPCGTGNNGNGNINYKSFVGPNSNDLKYAQQYHSFQQQLYATSTRNQQVGGANNMAPNPVANTGFFNNK